MRAPREQLSEHCRTCDKPITDNEYAANWGQCFECFDVDFDATYEAALKKAEETES